MTRDHEAKSSERDSSDKRVWQAPVMEELDVAASEASYVYGGTDAGIYTA